MAPRTMTEQAFFILTALVDTARHGYGIVGEVEITDCVTEHLSPWFTGPYGFLLRNARVLPFEPVSGSLRFFDVDEPCRDRDL